MSPNDPREPVRDGPAERAAPRLMLTVEQAAETLRIGRTTMFALVRSGEVESVRIGRLRRVPADALDAYTARQLDQSTAEGGSA
jgi:excisionase family DNA binding protein